MFCVQACVFVSVALSSYACAFMYIHPKEGGEESERGKKEGGRQRETDRQTETQSDRETDTETDE